MAAANGVAVLNPNSPKQLKDYFYKTLGHAAYKKKGVITTDTTALVRLARKGVIEAKLVEEIRKDSKLYGTYTTMKLDDDGRIRCFFDPSGASTGRLSSRGTLWGTGGNMQNLAPAFKKRMQFDKGMIGFEADLSQAENRIVAWVANEFALKHAFLTGVDVHSLTYANMFKIPLAEVSKKDGSSFVGDGSKSQRYWGKQMNHSLGYNLGYRAFALRFELPEGEARELVEGWHGLYPGVRGTFHAWVRAQLKESMTVVNCYGKQRKFFGQVGEVDQDAFAYVAQSTVAAKINMTLNHIWAERFGVFEPMHLLNQVHDSLIFELPLSIGWEAITDVCKAVKEKMEEPVPWKEPFVIPADFKMGTTFGNMVELKSLSSLGEIYEQAKM
jgi:DNA polymerase-1